MTIARKYRMIAAYVLAGELALGPSLLDRIDLPDYPVLHLRVARAKARA
jgi:hypothetical protein